MIPLHYKPIEFNAVHQERWSDYCERLPIEKDLAVREFYRQVVYDHFDRFNNHYPSFVLDDRGFLVRCMTAAEAAEQIRPVELLPSGTNDTIR